MQITQQTTHPPPTPSRQGQGETVSATHATLTRPVQGAGCEEGRGEDMGKATTPRRTGDRRPAVRVSVLSFGCREVVESCGTRPTDHDQRDHHHDDHRPPTTTTGRGTRSHTCRTPCLEPIPSAWRESRFSFGVWCTYPWHPGGSFYCRHRRRPPRTRAELPATLFCGDSCEMAMKGVSERGQGARGEIG